MKKGQIVLRHNTFKEDIPVVIALKAMGITSDKEIAELVSGADVALLNVFAPSLEFVARENIHTSEQALEYIGKQCKPPKQSDISKRGPRLRVPVSPQRYFG